MTNKLFFCVFAEFKKVGKGFYWLLVLGLPVAVFLITVAFLIFKREALAEQPIDLVISNNLGAWSALLYPLFLLVALQNSIDVESKNNLLLYSKSYRRTWIDLFLIKAAVATLVLTSITLVNVILNLSLIKIAAAYMISESTQVLLATSSTSFLRLIPAFLPLIFFHLMIGLLFQKRGIAPLIGILLTIIGLPIANLTDFYAIPYSFGIFALKPKLNLVAILCVGLSMIVLAPLISDAVIRRRAA